MNADLHCVHRITKSKRLLRDFERNKIKFAFDVHMEWKLPDSRYPPPWVNILCFHQIKAATTNKLIFHFPFCSLVLMMVLVDYTTKHMFARMFYCCLNALMGGEGCFNHNTFSSNEMSNIILSQTPR